MCMQIKCRTENSRRTKGKTRQCRKQAKGENGEGKATSTHSDGAASTAPLRNKQTTRRKKECKSCASAAAQHCRLQERAGESD